MMNREFSKKDYDNYMRVVIQNIQETESRLSRLDIDRKISQLSFEDWVKFQNGELKSLNQNKEESYRNWDNDEIINKEDE